MRSPRKTIVLVSPFVPYPPARGIELRIYRLLKWLSSSGFKVVLIVPTDSFTPEALFELRKVTHAIYWTKPAFRTRLGMRLPYLRRVLWESLKAALQRGRRQDNKTHSAVDQSAFPRDGSFALKSDPTPRLGEDHVKAWFASDKLVSLVGKIARRYSPHAVIVEYIFSTPVFASLPPGSIKMVDTIDVFSRKEEQVLAFGIADPLACSEEEERRQLLLADVVIAIQSREMKLLQELVPEREVILAGIDLDVAHSPDSAVIEGNIAVVASDNPLNVHGLNAFLVECWPLIKTQYPLATLHVVGRVGDLCRSEDSSIRYSGWVDSLDRVYAEASVVINPTIAGTGLKIKSVQALAHGKPLVAWPHGVEGLDFEGDAPFVEAKSWEEFSSAVVNLLRSNVDRCALAMRAQEYARREFSADTVYAALGDRLRSRVHQRPRGEYPDGQSAPRAKTLA